MSTEAQFLMTKRVNPSISLLKVKTGYGTENIAQKNLNIKYIFNSEEGKMKKGLDENCPLLIFSQMSERRDNL